jgi:hypothetical protein
MPKHKQKSIMEEELEAMSKGRTCVKEDEADRILTLIKKHATSISKTKNQYLEESNGERYAMYANIESAFDILMDDLRSEGFAV